MDSQKKVRTKHAKYWIERFNPVCVRRSTHLEDIKIFPTGSTYYGNWNALGMHGKGVYTFPHGVIYDGTMADGQFDGKGQLRYPAGQYFDGVWKNGILQSWVYTFKDGKQEEQRQSIDEPLDRRYHTSVDSTDQNAPGQEQLTSSPRPIQIPEGCFDAGDGFYNPKLRCVTSHMHPMKPIRIPTANEAILIQQNFRTHGDNTIGYRPDLFLDWTTGRSFYHKLTG